MGALFMSRIKKKTHYNYPTCLFIMLQMTLKSAL